MSDVRGTRILTRPEGVVLSIRRARLRVIRGPDKGRTLELGEQASALIGTHPDADMVLTDDAVSRQHAELRAGPTGWSIRDLGSTNGVLVGGIRIVEAVLENKSCVLSLGETDLELKLYDDEVEHALSARSSFGQAIGEGPSMRAVFAQLERVAPSDSTVLIEGESGTGKEALAEALHQASKRAEGPFVVFDCGAVAAQLIESELFGHEKGAFTGADRARVGALEEAAGGTLLLDEIGELPVDLQPKLLRALEARQVKRVGGTKPLDIDIRIVAATHRKLDRLVAEGKFRADLFYRLSVIKVVVPPLRHRPEDVLPLARRFITRMRPDASADALLTQGVSAALTAHRWPGNVRELRNAVERLLAVGELGTDVRTTEAIVPYHAAKQDAIDRFEREYTKDVYARSGHKVVRAAEAAGLSRQMFHRLLRKHEIGDE